MQKFAFAAIVAALGLVSTANAALLNNGNGLLSRNPDVVTSNPTITFVKSTGQLTISGFPGQLVYLDNSSTNLTGSTRNLTISAIVTGSGSTAAISSGSISVSARVASGPLASGASFVSLIASSIPLEFGFGSNRLEFVFGNNSGVLSVSPADNIGVIVAAPGVGGIPANFDFSTDLNVGTTAGAKIDAWVPEPAAMGLLAPAGLMLGARRRRA